MTEAEIQALIEKEIQALRDIPMDGSLQEAVALIHRSVHEGDGTVIVSGVGKAGEVGTKIANTLCSTGTPSYFLKPLEAQHGDLGLVRKQDILLLLSNSGYTREIIELVDQVKNLHGDMRIITITRNPDSALAKVGDVNLFTGQTEEICPLGLTPTTSTTVMTVIGDLLVVALMKRIGFTKEQYGLRHHSGYLGQKARG
ncbi:MAG: SIS domain-containing protein [Bacteroidetes bacterium]|jgi:arabinose-5-phosphate isomerase|nr:SIS domain-containing protein [Bacteroidota bacterium]MDA0973677.1 SIS domain-containing protein [Bacteroidota bacterium]